MIGLKNKLRESEEYFKYLRGFNVKHAQIVIGNILHYLQDNIQFMKKNYSFLVTCNIPIQIRKISQ